MIASIDNHLKSSLEDASKIHVEYFSAPAASSDGGAALVGGIVTATLRGKDIVVEVPASKTILDVLIDKGVDPPYSCSSGACSSCMAKVKEGSVSMDACFALDDDEIEEGYILTCQAHPTTAEVSLSFDE